MQVNCIAFAVDSSFIVTSFSDPHEDRIVLENLTADIRSVLLTLPGDDAIASVECSLDGQYILALAQSGNVHMWRIEKGNIADYRQFGLGEVEEASAMGFSPDSQHVYTIADGDVKVWQFPSWTISRIFSTIISSSAAAFVPDNLSIVIGGIGTLYRLNLMTGQVLQQSTVSAEPITKICFSYDVDSCYVWDTFDIFRWDLSTNTTSLLNHQLDLDRPCTAGDVTSDGKLLVSIFGKKVYTLTVKSWQILQQYRGHSEQVTSAIFSPEGRYVLTGSWDGTARLWDTYTGTELKKYV